MQPRIPGPDHPITIESHPGRVTVRAGGQVIAQSDHVLVLREANYPPVYYLPRTDAAMALLEPTDHHTTCPYKGVADYFSIVVAGDRRENAVWSYPQPFEAVAAIREHLAFYPDRVDMIETG